MKPFELVRAAADVIRTGGWAHGLDEAGIGVNARNHAGKEGPLMKVGTGETGRASLNPEAVSFSIYGALVKAAAGSVVEGGALLWDTLHDMSQAATGVAHGGLNHVHPVMQYNETEGRTVEDVLAFLELVAIELGGGLAQTTDKPLAPLPVSLVEAAKQFQPVPARGQTGFPVDGNVPPIQPSATPESRLPPIDWSK